MLLFRIDEQTQESKHFGHQVRGHQFVVVSRHACAVLQFLKDSPPNGPSCCGTPNGRAEIELALLSPSSQPPTAAPGGTSSPVSPRFLPEIRRGSSVSQLDSDGGGVVAASKRSASPPPPPLAHRAPSLTVSPRRGSVGSLADISGRPALPRPPSFPISPRRSDGTSTSGGAAVADLTGHSGAVSSPKPTFVLPFNTGVGIPASMESPRGNTRRAGQERHLQ
jgi:hypothetical protein